VRTEVHGSTIVLHQGDITEQDTDAIVNAANERLLHDGQHSTEGDLTMKKASIHLFFIAAIALTSASTSGESEKVSVEFVQGEDKIDVMFGEKLFTSYRYSDEMTKPILYPIHSPAGVVLNRGFPLAKVEGEAEDHPHHAGVFFTIDEVNGNEFWNGKTPPPQIEHIQVTGQKGGTGEGTLSTVMNWIGKSGKTLMEEKRTMVFIPGSDVYMIDFTMTLTAKEKVVIKDTKEGMFAIRTAHWLREKDQTGRYLSSNGEETAKNVWGRRAKWVTLQGDKDGHKVGIAIFNHPESFNYPTYWHARDYGLFSANPLGQSVFQKSRKEEPEPIDLTLEPGDSRLFKFKMLVYEGHKIRDQLEQLYLEYE